MVSILTITISIIIILTSGFLMWVVWHVVKEHARFRRALDIEMVQVLLPKDTHPETEEGGVGEEVKEPIAVAEQFFSVLSRLPITWFDRILYGAPVVVFEIVAHADGVIRFYAGTEHRFLDHLEKQIYALYPDAEVKKTADYTIFEPSDIIDGSFIRLRRSAHLPIATYKELEADPMQALTGALARIQRKDAAVIQYICQPASEKSRRAGRQAARRTMLGKQSDVHGASGFRYAHEKITMSRHQREKRELQAQKLTPRAQERIELVEQKVTQQQFAVTIRVAVSARDKEESQRILTGLSASFAQYDLPDLNSLHSVKQHNKQTFIRDFIFRVPRARFASILSTTEMASLFHFPLATTGTPNIAWRGARVAPVPAGLATSGIQLGNNNYRGIETPIYLASEDRSRHLYMIGQTGTGKTTLFLNMITQDIAAGRGVAVVDPHGDLIEDVLLHIPPERKDDVVLFDPRDTERPPGFNILEVHDEAQKDLVVNEVVQILQKLAARLNPESVGPMFEHYLRNALLALTEDPNATLIDVPRMFVDTSFRAAILARNSNPTVKQFWEKEFAQSQRGQMSADMLSYVISKLGRFISNRVMRNMIGQSKSSFDVRKIMDEGKILLCNLSKGSLGDINSDLLGFVLVSKIQIAALGRADIPEKERRDFYLYLDEFQNFTTDSIAIILSEARKYKLNLNLTHQFIQQLPDEIREAVFGNVGTIVSYRVGVNDVELLAKQFEPVFTEYDLLNLERFTACLRLLAHGTPQRPCTLNVLPPPVSGNVSVREEIRAASRAAYGRNQRDVEQEILTRFELGTKVPEEPAKKSQGYMSESLLDIS